MTHTGYLIFLIANRTSEVVGVDVLLACGTFTLTFELIALREYAVNRAFLPFGLEGEMLSYSGTSEL